MFSARVLADSLSVTNVRLTTLEVTLPRLVLAELNTHRMFSRNSASSRAIPVEKQIERVKQNPFMPEAFGENQKGMQSGETLDETRQIRARMAWLLGVERAIDTAEMLVDSGVHKQWANRVLEPYMWQTVIVSATDWKNFFKLRISDDAQPEIRKAAELMRDAMDASEPRQVNFDEWHLPLFDAEDWDEVIANFDNPMRKACMISAGRCARVSYLTHDGKRDLQADVDLAERLKASGHWSPFEHVASPLTYPTQYDGNFRGWRQFRTDMERGTCNVISILTAKSARKYQPWRP